MSRTKEATEVVEAPSVEVTPKQYVDPPLVPSQPVTKEQFIVLHTKDGPQVYDKAANVVRFPDGAAMTNAGEFRGYTLIDPPTDSSQLLRSKHRYVSLRLSREEHDFRQFKSDCEYSFTLNKHGVAPGPPADAADQLRAGAQRIAALREQLDELDQQIWELPEEVARRRQIEAQQQRESQQQATLREIMSIEY